MKLYDIPYEIEACFDEETGELDIDRLNAIKDAEDNKLEHLGKKYKAMKAEYTAVQAERKALQAREKSLENNMDSLARFIGEYLHGEKRTVGSVKFSFLGKQEGKINLLCKASELPPEYRKESISYREDTTALREAILNGEVEVLQYATLDPRPKASVK